MGEWVFGRRPVSEHLRHAPQTCLRLVLARGSRVSADLGAIAEGLGIAVEQADKAELARFAQGGNHQGVCLEVGGWSYAYVEDLVSRARQPSRLPVLLVLDAVEDPGNLGAVLRVADGVGAAGVIIPKDRSAGLSPTVARAAAGATASVPVARVVNIARTLRQLKEQGFWAVGASGEAAAGFYGQEVPFPCALVLGGEHKGLRPNVAAHCDLLVSLPMAGAVTSLNLAVAAGVFCYELLRRYRTAAHKGSV